MPDTVRSEAALLALFADNSSGAISEQDLRDFVKSVALTQVRRFVKTFAHAEILTWAHNSAPEVMPPAPAGKWYRVVSATLQSRLTAPYTNISRWSQLTMGWDDDSWDAIVAFFRNGSPGVCSLLATSSFALSFPYYDAGQDRAQRVVTADVIEKNLALYLSTQGDRPIATVAVADGGSGYTVGQQLNLDSGSGGNTASFLVATVDGGGAVLTVTPYVAGTGHADGSDLPVTGGGGTGCTVDVTVDLSTTITGGHADNTITVIVDYVLEDA